MSIILSAKLRIFVTCGRSNPSHKTQNFVTHDDVIKWKHFPRYSPFVWGIHRSPVNSPHKGQWRGALMFSLICTGINGWVNNGEAGDLRHHHAHYDVTVMWMQNCRLLRNLQLILIPGIKLLSFDKSKAWCTSQTMQAITPWSTFCENTFRSNMDFTDVISRKFWICHNSMVIRIFCQN